jgi:hypothetical protein
MPTELRRIVFSKTGLREALAGTSNVELPAGKLQAVRFDDDDRNRLAIEFTDPAADQTHKCLVLTTPFVAAALLRYCIAKRIPVQRSAQKALSMYGDNLALDLRSTSQAVEMSTLEGGS